MPNPKTDSGGFSSNNADQEQDMGAKGGPSTTLGSPDDHHGITAPYDSDLQTQIAAKSKANSDKKKSAEGDTDKQNDANHE